MHGSSMCAGGVAEVYQTPSNQVAAFLDVLFFTTVLYSTHVHAVLYKDQFRYPSIIAVSVHRVASPC